MSAPDISVEAGSVAWGIDFGGTALNAVRLRADGELVAIDAVYRSDGAGVPGGDPAARLAAAIGELVSRHPEVRQEPIYAVPPESGESPSILEARILER